LTIDGIVLGPYDNSVNPHLAIASMSATASLAPTISPNPPDIMVRELVPIKEKSTIKLGERISNETYQYSCFDNSLPDFIS
jgi:hypothetical protein